MKDLLFAYGTLLPGRAPPAMREMVGRMKIIGPASAFGRLFDLGDYPGLVLDSDAGRVWGQLLELPDGSAMWPRIDAYEGYAWDEPSRSLFRRVRCSVQTNDSRAVECWTYVYNDDAAPAPVIEDGVWRGPEESGRQADRGKSHRRPIIGITLGNSDENPTRYELPFDYATSVERAGGIPFPLAYKSELSLIPQIVDLLDGIVFSGGDDLDPALYGETRHPKAIPVDPERQRFEFALLAEIERRRVPALGICLGSQLMNVYRGGSLIQFLPDLERDGALEHRKTDDPTRRHAVQIRPGTILGDAIGATEIQSNSRHKQAIKEIGRGLRINALAPDGVIEGVEDPTFPLFLAVQWHPENLSAEPEHLAPFKLLVSRARAAAK